MLSVVAALASLNERCTARRLALITPRVGPIDLGAVVKHHVQGITRLDRPECTQFVVTVSGEEQGEIWFAEFERVDGVVAERGEVIATAVPALPHPGGVQACGELVAVACEAERGWARIELYDVSSIRTPRRVDTLVLDNSLREGVSQLTRSMAGWLGFAALGKGEYLLFVGGKQFGEREGWFYRYTPGGSPAFRFAGPFDGRVRSSSSDAWGPQSGAAIVRGKDGKPALITSGADDAKGRDALRSKLRCFSIDVPDQGPCSLIHQPSDLPSVYRLADAGLSHLFGGNARWGTTAFVDQRARLFAYFTARNPRPDRDHRHLLEITEVCCPT